MTYTFTHTFIKSITTLATVCSIAIAAFVLTAHVAHAIDISGTLYSDEGSTAITSGKTINMAVATGSPATVWSTTSNGSGNFTFSGIGTSDYGAGTEFLVWVDDGATTIGATLTKASSTSAGSDITGLDIYQNRLILRHEATSGTSTTNGDLTFYDNDNDPELPYMSDPTYEDLDVESGIELHVWTGDTYAPGGDVTLHGDSGASPDGDFHLPDSATFTQGGRMTLAGSWSASSTATFTPDYNGVTFNATTTGKTLSGGMTGTSNDFDSILFDGVGGGWTFSDNASTTNVTIATGTLAAPSDLLSVSGSLWNWGGTFDANGGTITLNGTGPVGEQWRAIAGTTTSYNGSWIDSDGYNYIQHMISREGNLYAGTGDTGNSGEGDVWEYKDDAWTKIGGDGVNSSWTASAIGDDGLAVVNDHLYVGTSNGNGGTNDEAYVYELQSGSTTWRKIGGDPNFGSWDADLVDPEDKQTVESMLSLNGKLYVGLGLGNGDSEVWEWDPDAESWTKIADGSSGLNSSWVDDASGDFQRLESFGRSAGGHLYAGLGASPGDGEVWEYQNGSTTWRKIGGDGINSSWTGDHVLSLANIGERLYAGVDDDVLGSVWEWDPDTETWTQIGGNSINSSWTAERVQSLVVFNGMLYAGLGAGQAEYEDSVWEWDGTTWRQIGSNDINGSWDFDTAEFSAIRALAVHNGKLYSNNGQEELWEFSPRQYVAGNFSGSNALNNLELTNTSGTGPRDPSLIFGSGVATDGTFTLNASTSVMFPSNATTSFASISWNGEADATQIWLRSHATTSQQWGLDVTTMSPVSYVDVKDSNACNDGDLVDADDQTSTNSGNNTCWDFSPDASISSASNQTFAVGQATTTAADITITEVSAPADTTITSGNGLRIAIATSTHGMRFDTNASPTFSGDASGKVDSVTYEGGDSVVLLTLNAGFAVDETLTISGLEFGNFTTLVSPASSALFTLTDGASDQTANNTDDKTVGITGSLTLAEHDNGQVADAFNIDSTVTGEDLFAFKLTPSDEDVTITSLPLTLSGVDGIVQSDVSNVQLHIDYDGDGVIDGGDETVGGAGSVSISGSSGSITFSSSFTATTSRNYVVIGDVSFISPSDRMTVSLDVDDISHTGVTTGGSVGLFGSASSIQHIRGTGAGGSGSDTGGSPPAGAGVVTGGGQGGGGDIGTGESGDTIGSEPGFETPAAVSAVAQWTSGDDGRVSDDARAQGTVGQVQEYTTFGFSVPGGNSVNGIEVKLEANGVGSIGVELGIGSATTSAGLTTGALTGSDAVYTVGGSSELFGRSWSPSEFDDGTFVLELTAISDTVNLDAVQVRVHHSAGGGGQGGGSEVRRPQLQHFAGVLEAVRELIPDWLLEIF